MVARGLAVLVAIIVAGWFGLSARQAHDINAAESILANVSNPNPGQARHVTRCCARRRRSTPTSRSMCCGVTSPPAKVPANARRRSSAASPGASR